MEKITVWIAGVCLVAGMIGAMIAHSIHTDREVELYSATHCTFWDGEEVVTYDMACEDMER